MPAKNSRNPKSFRTNVKESINNKIKKTNKKQKVVKTVNHVC